MRKKIPRGIKIVVSLMFVSAFLILPAILHPHLVLMGLFFIEGAEAGMLAILALISIGILIYMVTRRMSKAYYPAMWLYAVIGFNSLMNLILAGRYGDDMRGFLGRIYGDLDIIGGYFLAQIIIVILCIVLILYLWANRPVLSRR
jgi:hypothetical protein